MMHTASEKIKTTDPGLAANAAARAVVLFARVSGYVADNLERERNGYAMAYSSEAFEEAINELFPELATPAPERDEGSE